MANGALLSFLQNLEGTFSAVSKPTSASTDSFCNVFQALQYLRKFAAVTVPEFSFYAAPLRRAGRSLLLLQRRVRHQVYSV